MKNFWILFMLFAALPLAAAPTTTVTVHRPTTASSVTRPTTAAEVSRPTTAVSVSHPTTVVPVLHPTTTATNVRPTTQVSVHRPGEQGLSYVPVTPGVRATPAADKPASAAASSSASSSSSAGGSYTPSYKQAKDLSATTAKNISQTALSEKTTGLAMSDPNASQKEADARATQVQKAMSSQVSTDEVLKNTKIPDNVKAALEKATSKK